MESRRTRNLPGGGLRPALAMLAGVSPAASLLGGMAHSRRILFLLCAVLACGTASASPRVPPWGVNLGYVDPAARPGENFFTFANGARNIFSLSPQDPNHLRGSYGPADYDVRHSFNASYVWEVPVRAVLRGGGLILWY